MANAYSYHTRVVPPRLPTNILTRASQPFVEWVCQSDEQAGAISHAICRLAAGEQWLVRCVSADVEI